MIESPRGVKSENLELCERFGRKKVEGERVNESLAIIRSRVFEVYKRAFGIALALFRPGFFYRLKVQEGVFRDPPYDLRIH